MENTKKVLLFHLPDSKILQIDALCRRLDIQAMKITPRQYGLSLGFLAGVQGFKRTASPYQGPDFPTEMMVFSGIHSGELDRFLKAYAEAGIAPVPLKAVLTPDNIFWNAETLYRELLQEHTFFQKNAFPRKPS